MSNSAQEDRTRGSSVFSSVFNIAWHLRLFLQPLCLIYAEDDHLFGVIGFSIDETSLPRPVNPSYGAIAYTNYHRYQSLLAFTIINLDNSRKT